MMSYLQRTGRSLTFAAVLLLLAAPALWGVGQAGPTAQAETPVESAHLPAVFKPENTPTPQPTNTPDPTPTATPGPTGTPRPTPSPGDPNKLVNGDFEDVNWTDIYSPVDNQLKQQPTGWTLSWLAIGERLYDEPPGSQWVAGGLPECLHKDINTLPENEHPGQPDALILDGIQTYKMFNSGAPFGGELSQVVENLPAGRYRLTVPVQLHWQEKLDPGGSGWDHDTAESGAWVIVNGQKLGRWANALEMGDREWAYHVVEFELTAPADVEVLLRFKSRYANKDFFFDAVRLETIH
jgi:hypothetical protein